jgi:plasmid stabilization system protein ParE
MGHKVAEFGLDAVRQRIVYSYRLIYRLSEHVIEIVAVIHGSRLISPVEVRLT